MLLLVSTATEQLDGLGLVLLTGQRNSVNEPPGLFSLCSQTTQSISVLKREGFEDMKAAACPRGADHSLFCTC